MDMSMPRWLELQAEIDYLHFLLGNMYEHSKRATPIERLIDEATGFDKQRIKEAEELIAELEAKKKEYYELTK